MEQNSLIQELASKLSAGPARALFERGVAQSATAAGMCDLLEGKTLQILPGSTALAVYFVVADGQLEMRSGVVDEPDATLAGSPLSLTRLSGNDPEATIREGAVKVSGDTEVADQYRYLFSQLKPDFEELLSRVTGDVVAHEIGRAARGFAGWAAKARRSVGRSASEYLTEESAALATAVEIDEFCSEVDELAAATDRLEARLKLISAANKVEE